jgi:geranylgeranyl diphosphate synthase type II
VTRSGAADVREYLREQGAVIDRALERYLPAGGDCPPLIVEAMRYSLFAGGKRLRPILTLAAAETVAPDVSPAHAADALQAACAIEMIHTYSLVHDDLPAMDDDTLRRGQPTAHVVYGEGIAILAGDALLTEAFRVLARSSESETADRRGRRLRTLERIATAAGAEGMVGGQVIDLAATGATAAFDADRLRAMHGRKTGALIRAAAVAGAIMGGASDADADAVDRYAAHLGLAFQIVDDILDETASSDTLGKTSGKDRKQRKATYPSVHGIEASRRMVGRITAQARERTRSLGDRGELLVHIADYLEKRSN